DGRPAGDARGEIPVNRAVVAHPVAGLGRVAQVGRRPADRRALGIGRTRGAGAAAEIGDVAEARSGAALGGRRQEAVGRARGAAAGAELGLIARAGDGPALRAAVLEAVRGAVVGHAVAGLGHVARAGARPADARALGVGGTGCARPRARLGGCAGARPGAGLD